MAEQIVAYKAVTSGRIYESEAEAVAEDAYNDLAEFVGKNTSYSDSEAVMALINQHGQELKVRLDCYLENKL